MFIQLKALEVLCLEPFQFEESTAQCVQAWQDLVNKVITNYPRKFEKLTSRRCQGPYNVHNRKKHEKKNADELEANVISPEPSGLDNIFNEKNRKDGDKCGRE